MNVVFEEQAPRGTTPLYAPHGITGWLLTHHVVSTVSQAQTLLVSAALIFFVTSGVLWHATLKDTSVDTHKGLRDAPTTSAR